MCMAACCVLGALLVCCIFVKTLLFMCVGTDVKWIPFCLYRLHNVNLIVSGYFSEIEFAGGCFSVG